MAMLPVQAEYAWRSFDEQSRALQQLLGAVSQGLRGRHQAQKEEAQRQAALQMFGMRDIAAQNLAGMHHVYRMDEIAQAARLKAAGGAPVAQILGVRQRIRDSVRKMVSKLDPMMQAEAVELLSQHAQAQIGDGPDLGPEQQHRLDTLMAGAPQAAADFETALSEARERPKRATQTHGGEIRAGLQRQSGEIRGALQQQSQGFQAQKQSEAQAAQAGLAQYRALAGAASRGVEPGMAGSVEAAQKNIRRIGDPLSLAPTAPTPITPPGFTLPNIRGPSGAPASLARRGMSARNPTSGAMEADMRRFSLYHHQQGTDEETYRRRFLERYGFDPVEAP